jgi:exodeoxyribonuclease III
VASCKARNQCRPSIGGTAKRDGPTYHIDYIFLPTQWLGHVRELDIGTFEDWCGSGLSDHVPIVVDIDL